MENILNHAYFTRHCHQCGHSYTLTLYGVLQEQRLRKEWENLQGRSAVWDADTLHVLDAIPREALETIEEAWQAILQGSQQAGLDLLIDQGHEEQLHRHDAHPA